MSFGSYRALVDKSNFCVEEGTMNKYFCYSFIYFIFIYFLFICFEFRIELDNLPNQTIFCSNRTVFLYFLSFLKLDIYVCYLRLLQNFEK